MGIERNHRFPVAFDEVFQKGLVLNGSVEPDNEYQQNRNAAPRQKTDPETGLLMWKAMFSDPDHVKESEASIKVTFLAKHMPVPTTEEFLKGCGMRPAVLEELQVSPRLSGQGEFKRLSWNYFATGFAPAGSGAGSAGSKSTSTGAKSSSESSVPRAA